MKKSKNYIGTYNKGQFWVDSPMVEDISFEEITHALAYNVRFNGHTDIFWSVAQHSLLVEKIMLDLCERDSMEDKHKAGLIALIHDFSEGYMSDIARPFKKLLPDYKEFENSVQNCIHESLSIYDIPENIKKLVREADTIALAVEVDTILNPCEQWIRDYSYMEDTRIDKYKHIVKNMCPDIVQSLLMNKLFEYMKTMGISNEHKNNSEMYSIFTFTDDKIAIVKNGEQLALFRVIGDEYEFTVRDVKNDVLKTIKQSIVDNTMDLRKLLL